MRAMSVLLELLVDAAGTAGTLISVVQHYSVERDRIERIG